MKKKPCNGCLERKLPVAERVLNTTPAGELAKQAGDDQPIEKVLIVVVRMEGAQRLIGKVTGRDYGVATFGAVTAMDVSDAAADNRVLRATQETLRMVS